MASHIEVARAWVNQTGKHTNGHNMFYDGTTVYSYGRHFPIARLVEVAGRTVVLMTSRDYSVSTAKHKSIVWSAVYRHGLEMFHVNDPSAHVSVADFEAIMAQAAEYDGKASRARTHGQHYREQAAALRQRAASMARVFCLPVPALEVRCLELAA